MGLEEGGSKPLLKICNKKKIKGVIQVTLAFTLYGKIEGIWSPPIFISCGDK
jgi:hypothetical protein